MLRTTMPADSLQRGHQAPAYARLLFLLFLVLLSGCTHPAERALEGRWDGQSVENFDQESIAAASGWARGTSFEFEGNRVKVTVPAEEPRAGVYRLTSIEDRNLTLTVLDSRGTETDLDLIFDDTTSLRWVLGEGRTLVLKRKD